MPDSPLFHIARGSDVLGEYTLPQIHEKIVKGDFLPTDIFYNLESEEWKTLLPPFPCRVWVPLDGDLPFYYISNNRIYGPRSKEEMIALYQSKVITKETLCTSCMQEWESFSPIANAIDKESEQRNHIQSAIKHAVQGNYFGAALNAGKAGLNFLNALPEAEDSETKKEQ